VVQEKNTNIAMADGAIIAGAIIKKHIVLTTICKNR
jgi:hypothetical protein